jgi:flagellar basal body rod protein FlgG
MIRALYSGGSGMNAQQMSIGNIANNLANSSTAAWGFGLAKLIAKGLAPK